MKKYPFCSIIVLNYFGEQVLERTINSLLDINYPKENYEIIIVDNNSKDKSHELMEKIAQENSNVKNIFLDKNYGFSKGNNFGIKEARGDFIALVNNDCVVTKDWLGELVKPALEDEKVFAVNSKILLYNKFLLTKYWLNPKLAPVYAWVSKSEMYNNSDIKLSYLEFKKKPELNDEKGNCYEAEITFDPNENKDIELTLLFSSRGKKITEKELAKYLIFENTELKIKSSKFIGHEIEFKVSINTSSKKISSATLNRIQNAGIVIFQDGYGRDIGAIVSAGRQWYEFDSGQYNKQKEVYAACGAAVLYNKKILDKIGYLDESFFMYYEDVEICERARFFGFKTVYSPKAVVRHMHAASSKEWSAFFIYNVEKNRLMHVFYNFPLKVFIYEYFKIFLYSLFYLLMAFYRIRLLFYQVKTRKKENGEPPFIRRIQIVKSLLFFTINFPMLFIRRIQKNSIRGRKSVYDNYDSILSGRWYF